MRNRPAAARLRTRLAVVAVTAGLLGANAASPALAAPDGARTDFPPRIEPMPPFQKQTTCDPHEKPGVQEFRELILDSYDGRSGGIVRECHIGGASEHKEGRAWDWMLDADDPEDQARAEAVLEWLFATDEHGNEAAMARRFGVMYVIWDGRIWSAPKADQGWRPYKGWSPHDDHIHFSFTREGAAAQTSYWHDIPEPVVASALAEDPLIERPTSSASAPSTGPVRAALGWVLDNALPLASPTLDVPSDA